ncbi:OsmC family protein [Nocardioides sp. AX2bis]|uniref:OsmC family protein n=1 Tax=Nocardioides sp. AX2bis TaxID=2653157 RepID=UPI0012F3EE62|nr:OsmC family protein [Nocardioides sp. AX2bis]VXB18177.1 Osmotically inducible protein C [Nocardioides sp. AX2bis]
MTTSTEQAADDGRRGVELRKIGAGRYLASNGRGGVLPVGRGSDPDFTPVELLLAAIAGCSAVDIELVTGKRVDPDHVHLAVEGHKTRDDDGNHLTGIRVSVDVGFPEGPDGDRARSMLPRAVEQTRDRLCTVSRTVQLATPVAYDLVSPAGSDPHGTTDPSQ